MNRATTFAAIRKLAASHVPPAEVVGEPVQVHDMFRYVEDDGRTLFWWSLGLLAAVILLLVFTRDIDGWHVIAALVILLREIIVSGLREFLATLQVSMPVTQLAKWKTTFQLVSFGALILAGALPAMLWVKTVGLVALWGAAVLTLITGWDYLRVGLKHMD